LEFELPPLPEGSCWQRMADTAQPSPDDFSNPAGGVPLPCDQRTYPAQPRSVVVFRSGQI
jgi:hypothetical protein